MSSVSKVLVSRLEFPASISVSSGCLGKKFTTSIGGVVGVIEMPSLHWSDDDQALLVIPGISNEAHERLTQRVDTNLWGSVNEWNSKDRTAHVIEVGAVLFRFATTSPVQYSNYLYGLGHPITATLSTLYGSFDDWFDRFRTWLEVKSQLDLDPVFPVRTVQQPGRGVLAWTEDDEVTSLPASANQIVVSLDETRKRRRISLPNLRNALKFVESNVEPTREHVLLRDARAAMNRGQMRRAVNDAATAVENALKSSASAHQINVGSRPMLGNLVNHGALGRVVRIPDSTQTRLVDVRNNATHNNVVPSLPQARRALSVAQRIVECVDPLPF